MEGIPVRKLMKIAHHLGRLNFEGQTQRLPERTSDASCPVDECAVLACLASSSISQSNCYESKDGRYKNITADWRLLKSSSKVCVAT